MSFSVLILGSGSALPTLHSNQSAQVVETESELYLIDCGEGTQIELRRQKVRIQRINQIFISHLHGDHFFGLVGLLSTMHLLGRVKELHIYAPEGLEEIIRIQFRNAGNHLCYKMHFHVISESNQIIFEDKNMKVKSLPLKHRIPTFGFLFEEQPQLRRLDATALEKYSIPNFARKAITKGEDFVNEEGKIIPNAELSRPPEPPATYAYCSDTAYHEPLLASLPKVDLLYHESTFLEKDRERAKKTYHSTAKDAAQLANLSGARKLLLGHFSNRYKNKEAFLGEARPVFSESFIAEEGVRYEVRSSE